jgi:hypothetical protein
MGLPRVTSPETMVPALALAFDRIESYEPWHEVGAAGQPAFQGTWVNYGGAAETAAFYKDASGIVRLKGTIKSGALTTPAFTLPAGYRPAGEIIFAVVSNLAFGELVITTAGLVTPYVGNNQSFGLNVSFRTA